MDTIIDDLGTRLAHRLKLERDSRGWSLAELAEASGVSKATISKIERAEVTPTAVILVRLAAAFNLTLAGLMLRAEGQGQRLVALRRAAGLARPRDRLSAQAGVQPSRSSRRNRQGRIAGGATGDAAGVVLRAYPPDRLGAEGQPRDRPRPASGSFSAPATASVLVRPRKRPSPTRPRRPALTSSHSPGADIVQGNIQAIRIAPLTASPEIRRGAERTAGRDGRAAAARSVSCIRWRRTTPTRSGGTRLAQPIAASGSCSAPSMVRS